VTTGKSYLDVRQALDDLGIDDAQAADIGIRLYKVAMSWPLEREGIQRFAEGLEEILVVEEKRAIIENHSKSNFTIGARTCAKSCREFDEHRSGFAVERRADTAQIAGLSPIASPASYFARFPSALPSGAKTSAR